VSSFRQSPQSASERNALVVCYTESGLMPLPGAQQEAMTVGGAHAGGGFTVAGPLIKPRSLTLINELFARDYRVLHLAAHGDYNQLKPDESGIVRGDGIFLTSKEVEKLRVGALYLAAIKSAKTRFQIASIDDHLAFVLAMLEGKPGSKEMIERIEEVRNRIQK
jgi:hypothetical protein